MTPSTSSIDPRESTYLVAGMSCGHCEVAVTGELSKVAGVEAVDVDLVAKLVRVHGTDVDDAAVVAAIDEAGYDAVPAIGGADLPGPAQRVAA